VRKIAIKVFESIDLDRKGHAFLGHALYKGPKFLFSLKIWGVWVSRDAEFNVDFKNINLY
jgi:hypothetical protein